MIAGLLAKLGFLTFLILVPVLTLAGEAATASSHVPIRIECAKPLQEIDGFGSSAVIGFAGLERGFFDQVVPWGTTYKTTPEQRKALVEALVRDLGMTHLRIWIWPGIEDKNDNEDPALMNESAFTWNGQCGQPTSRNMLDNRYNGIHEWGEFLKLAVPLGLKNWIITPGKVPVWLEKRLADPNDASRFDEYSEWAVAHLLYLKKTFGLEAPYWSIANEPDNFKWTGAAFWTPMVKATGARFRKEGLKTKIMFPDYMNVQAAVPLCAEVLKDDEARSYIGALAYHHYRSSGDGPQPFLDAVASPQTADTGKVYEQITGPARRMAELGQKYRLPSWDTETAYYIHHLRGMSEWQVGRGRANEIYYELASGASSVQGMCMFWPDSEDPRYKASEKDVGHHLLLYTDGKNLSRWYVNKSSGAVFAHYARFVRPGDRRLTTECPDALLRVTAFVSEKNRQYVAVVVNNHPEQRTVHLALPEAAWKINFAGGLLSDDSHMLDPWPLVAEAGSGRSFEAQLPPMSLTTFVWSECDHGKLTIPDELLKH